MSKRGQDAATATFGYAGVSGGALLRHDALADAYGERYHRPGTPSRRPMLGAERKLLRNSKGRARYLSGVLLATASAPAAAKGTHDLVTASKRRTFVEDGVSGLTESLQEKQTNTRRTPTKLAAGNYLAGTATGLATGGAVQYALRHRKIGGGAKSVLASNATVLAGVGSLPIQRKIVEHRTKGAYTATPTGLKRVPRNQSARHGTRLAKRNDQATGMSRAEELRNIKRKQHTAAVNAVTSAGGIGSLGMLGAAALPHVKNRGRLVRAATILGTASGGASSVNGLESARLQRRDLRAREQVLTEASKAVIPPDKDILTFWGNNGSWKALNRGAAKHPSNERWRLSAERGKARNKARSRRVVPMGLDPRDYYEWQHGPVIKALGMPRAPRMRRGFLRQTRTATGLTTSAVRGGLIR